MNRIVAAVAALVLLAPPAWAQDDRYPSEFDSGRTRAANDGLFPPHGDRSPGEELDPPQPRGDGVAVRQNSPDVILDSDRAQAEDLARFDASAADLVAALRPASPERYDDADYMRNVYRVTLTVHPGLARAQAFDPAAPTASRRLALNDNHSRDLPAPFLSGDPELTPAARVVIDTLAEALAAPALASSRYLIAVHTDTSGPADLNAWLAEKRAAAVIDDLVERHAIARSRLVGAGFGEAYPLSGVSGDSPRNHRIEVTLIEADDGEEAAIADADPADAEWPGEAAPLPGPSRAELETERRAEAAERRRARILRARRAGIDRFAEAGGEVPEAGGEVPEAVLDRHGRIGGARIARPHRRFRTAPCDPYGRFVGACEMIVVRP